MKVFLNIINTVLNFIKNNPKFFLGVIFVLFIVLFFKQCSNIKELKHDIEVKEVESQNEQNRYLNNIKNLKDSVEYHEDQEVYSKTLLRVKEGELEKLNAELYSYQKELKRLANIIQNGTEIKNVYITKISSEIDKHDVNTITKTDSVGNFAIGINDTNQIITINTESWFRLVPDNNMMRIKFVDKFGRDSVSRLRYNLNFSLGLSQIELENGNTRLLVQARDRNNNIIPPDILTIPFVNGVDFIDVEPNTIEPPKEPKNRRGFGVMIGPSYGLYNINGSFQPTWGIGLSVGYKIL